MWKLPAGVVSSPKNRQRLLKLHPAVTPVFFVFRQLPQESSEITETSQRAEETSCRSYVSSPKNRQRLLKRSRFHPPRLARIVSSPKNRQRLLKPELLRWPRSNVAIVSSPKNRQRLLKPFVGELNLSSVLGQLPQESSEITETCLLSPFSLKGTVAKPSWSSLAPKRGRSPGGAPPGPNTFIFAGPAVAPSLASEVWECIPQTAVAELFAGRAS